jgi:hypothetical protein
MHALIKPLVLALAASLALLAGCQDKHEPLKPTVAASASVHYCPELQGSIESGRRIGSRSRFHSNRHWAAKMG